MPRKRSTNNDLAAFPGLRRKGAAFYYVLKGKPERWIPLGSDYHQAVKLWAEYQMAERPEKGTVSDMIAKYRAEYLPKLGERTQEDYRRILTTLNKVFGNMRPRQVKPHHVGQYLDLHSHPTAANREIAVLSGVFTYGMRHGKCEANPCRGVKRNQEKARDRYVEDWELQKRIQVAQGMGHPMVACVAQFAYLTALDLSDVLPLKRTDIRDGQLTVSRSKTGRGVTIRISPAVREVLDNAASAWSKSGRAVSSMYLFPSRRRGKPYTADGFKSVWQQIKRADGMDWRFKDIRAKALTDVSRQAGKDAARLLAAHASGETTEVYIRARDKVVVDPVR